VVDVALARVLVQGAIEVSSLVSVRPTPLAERVRTAAAPWLWPVAGATAVSAALELGVLRVFTRTIIHIPGAGDVSPVLSAIAELGRLAYYVTCVLLIGLLALIAFRSSLASSRSLVVTTVIVVFGVAALGARTGIVGDGTVAVGVLVAAITLGVIAAAPLPPTARVAIAAFSAAFALTALDAMVGGGVVRIGRDGALRAAGETLALLAAIASPFVLRARPDRRSVVLGGAAGLLAVVLLVANSSTANILMLWNLGLTGIFPWVFYGAAVGALTCTVAASMHSGDRRAVVVIALLVAGGLGLHSTYQSGLVIAGLALLALKAETGAVEDQVLEPGGSAAHVSTSPTRISATTSGASVDASKG